MPDEEHQQRPLAATCEDEEDEDLHHYTDMRASANVAAKRSKPDLTSKASYERHRTHEVDSGYTSRAPTVYREANTQNEKHRVDLRLDTTIKERERQPYHFATCKEKPQEKLSSRPVLGRTQSKKATRLFGLRREEDMAYERDGKHVDSRRDNPGMHSPISARPNAHHDEGRERVNEDARLHRRRSTSTRVPRLAGMYTPVSSNPYDTTMPSPGEFAIAPPIYGAPSWQAHQPPPPLYHGPVAYATYSVPIVSQSLSSIESSSSYFRGAPQAHDRPREKEKRSSMHLEQSTPVFKYAPTPKEVNFAPQVKTSRETRPPLPTQKSSYDKDYDRYVMPPPPQPKQHPQVVLAHRPSVKRSETSVSAASAHRRSQSYEAEGREYRKQTLPKERPVERSLPPSSYRGPTNISPERRAPHNPISHSYDRYESSRQTSTAPNPLGRRLAEPTPERHEAEAEAYQRKRDASESQEIRTNGLTAEQFHKLVKSRPKPPRSETNSSHKSHNPSSKGSSGGKTGRSNSEMTLTINGIAVGLPNDSAQRITIQHKGVNICVGGNSQSERKGRSPTRPGRASSVASRASKSSSNHEKSRRVDDEGDARRGREYDAAEPNRRPESIVPERRSQSIKRYSYHGDVSEPLVYGG